MEKSMKIGDIVQYNGSIFNGDDHFDYVIDVEIIDIDENEVLVMDSECNERWTSWDSLVAIK